MKRALVIGTALLTASRIRITIAVLLVVVGGALSGRITRYEVQVRPVGDTDPMAGPVSPWSGYGAAYSYSPTWTGPVAAVVGVAAFGGALVILRRRSFSTLG